MKTIKDKNGMIAEFMGYRWMGDDNMWIKGEWPKTKIMDNDLEYDTSWDWLVPVVKKCKNVLANPRDANDIYRLQDLEIAIFSCEITITFDAVIGFIKWYNEQK